MAQYLSSLRDILVMRRKGQFHQVIFDTYNEMLAALPDGKVTEMYKNFMLIYLEEADDATLEFMTLGQNDRVDDNVLGFAEMMTIKLGEMMDQPAARAHGRHCKREAKEVGAGEGAAGEGGERSEELREDGRVARGDCDVVCECDAGD